MKFHLDSKTFRAERAWGTRDIGLVEARILVIEKQGSV